MAASFGVTSFTRTTNLFLFLKIDEDGMSRTMLVAAAVAIGVVALPMQADAEYNPGVQVRYDAMGNLVEGPGSAGYSSGGPSYTPIPREVVSAPGNYGAGTIVVNTAERRLYLMLGDGKALKYGIGVGRPGCFRMTNDDVTDLYERVRVGARVVVIN